MYLSPVGGSGLLHLLAAHPRAVAVLGIVGVVTMLSSSHGGGRYVGTEQYLERIERSLGSPDLASAARRARADSEVLRLLERNEPDAIENAVSSVLRRCGDGCTDLAVATIIRDRQLLQQVLTLDALDRAVRDDRLAVTGGE